MRVSKLGLASGLMVFLTLVSSFILGSSRITAEGNNREGGSACNLSYSIDDNHSVTVMIGTYMPNIGTSTFNVVCNDNAGFSIYAVGYSDNTLGNNKMSATIGGVLDSEHDIITGTAINGDISNWAMKINAVSGTYAPTIENNFNDYSLIPSTYSKIASFAAETDDTVGSSLQSAYAIYISPTQPVGTYTGKVKYTLVHPYNETPCTEGKICYHKNANNVVGSMGRQNATGTTAMLMASNFSHDGYGFAGWNTEEDGTGTSYGPNETITLPNDMSEGLNLYAMWIKSTGSLQDWDGCYNMNIGDVTALTDMRDNDTYAIAKLADGKCWMIENLRLDNTNSDNATGALAQGYGTSATYGNFSGLADPEAPWIGDSTTANSLYSIDGSDGTINIGADNNPSRRFPRYNNQNTASRDSYPTTNQNIYSYGNYYTWAAAIADLNPNNTNNQITTGTSLCPTGWRLPSGGAAYASDSTTGVNVTGDTSTYRDFYNLGYKIMDEVKTAYEDTVGNDGAYYSGDTTNLVGDTATKAFRKYPNNFVLSGYVYNDSISNRSSFGLYWSSTARDAGYAYRLYINNNIVYPSTAGGNKYYGRSVRCVTNPMQRYEVTVNFDSGVESVMLRSDDFGTKTITTSGTVVSLAKDVEYTISGSYINEHGFESWTTTSRGTLGSTTSAETTYTVSGTATLTLYSKKICSQGYICYDKNNRDANAPGGDMGNQAVSGTSATLWASNYGREGYGFAGWNTSADGSGTSYGPNETITFDPTDEDGLMLYAMWVEPRGTLQKFSCTKNMPVGTIIGLLDERDDQVYAVAKLSDGKCWMIENLRIENYSTMTPSQKELSQGYGGAFTGLAAPELDTFADVTTSNSLYDNRDIVGNNFSSRIPRYRDDNKRNAVAKMTSENQQVYSYGNYYNFPATIANTTDFTSQGEITTTSLCPTGWRIPSGGSKGYKDDSDYWALIVDALNEGVTPTSSGGNIYDGDAVAINLSNTIRRYPNNFLNSGHVENGSSMNGKGGRGDYWSATNGDNDEAFRFSFRFAGVNPGTSPLHKYKGLAVRCVTGTVAKRTVTVNFDDGVSEVSLQSDNFGKYTVTTSGSTVKLAEGVTYTISGTYSADDRGFDNWATTSNGVLGDATSRETTYTISDDATLTLTSKEVCLSGKICYKRNDTVTGTLEGTMGRQNVEASSTATTLWASNYSNSEYGFAGWNTEPDGSGISYGPNETITYESGTYNSPNYGLLLYANWVESEGSLQGWNRCSALSVGDVTALTDRRDNQVYAVAKLVDGNCWMIENLRLEYGSTRGATNQALAQGYGGVFTGLAEPETDSFDNVNTPNSLYTTDTTSTTLNIITGDGVNFRIPRYRNDYTSNRVSEMTSGSDAVYSYGNYYNFAAAIANTDVVRDANQSAGSTSICPTGWRLPKGGDKNNETNNEFWALVVDGLNNGTLPTNYAGETTPYYTTDGAEVSKKVRKYPNNFVLSGASWGGSETGNRGSSGFYWTSTVGSSSYAYTFMVHQGENVHPGTYNINKWNGRSVRCVYNDTSLDGFGYMQDFAELTASEMDALKASMTEGEQYTIVDSRDNKVYYISKLADGNIWMTQNLDFDIGSTTLTHNSTTLYHDDTDLGYGTSTNQSWTPDKATYTTGTTTWALDSAGYDIQQSYDPGDKIWNGVVDSSYGTTIDNMAQGTDRHYHIGNNYNWGAAVAMNDTSSYTSSGVDVDQSICPAGWRLPKGGSDTSSGSFNYLVNHYNYDDSNYTMSNPRIWEAPIYFTFSSGWIGSFDAMATEGYMWSSVVDDGQNAYGLGSSISNVLPDSHGARDFGIVVRCVARTPEKSIDDLEYMQDFVSLTEQEKQEVMDSMTENEQYQLTDSRDNKTYYISKLADGNIWMTQNLDFDIVNGGADINSTNTDVPSDWADAGGLTNTHAVDDTNWSFSFTDSDSYDPGNICWNETITTDQFMTLSDYGTECNQNGSHYHLGNYYNWTAAVAMSDSSSYNTENADANQSICPAGWTLPKGGSDTGSGSLAYLIEKVGLTSGDSGNAHISPTFFSYAGSWNGNSGFVGYGGFYWSSVAKSGGYVANSLIITPYIASPSGSGERSAGYPVRCVAR